MVSTNAVRPAIYCQVDLTNDGDIIAAVEWAMAWQHLPRWEVSSVTGFARLDDEDDRHPCLLSVLIHQAQYYDTAVVYLYH